jgi:hypothetical protein
MNQKKFSKIFVFFSVLLLFFAYHSLGETIKTPAEDVRYTRYSQHEEIARFLSALDFLSPEVTIQVIGKTKEEREFPSKDLFLVIISEEGAGSPENLNRQKPTILLTASQHGNEQSAKEAALRLVRDLAVGELKPYLKQANFLIIPQANPYGNWFDQRQNEQNLDLNRDHVKLESEEVRAIHRVFRGWTPEVTLDVHEKGDDYYRVSIGCVSNVNIDPKLEEFSRKTILAEVEKNLEKKRVTFHEYLVTQEMGIDSSAGVRYRPEDVAGREEMMRYSTTDLNDGRNSLGIYETLSFIQEGASRHDLETLKQRTDWQYLGIRYFMQAITEHGKEVISLVRELRGNLVEKAKVYAEDDLVHLQMEYVRDENNPILTIKTFERAESPVRGILKVDKKAGEALMDSELEPYSYPSRYKVRTESTKNWFPAVAPTLSIPRPLGYVIPAKHQDVIEVLLDHGLQVDIFAADKTLDVEAYVTGEVIPSKYDYLPPEKIEVERKILQTVVKKGDFYVGCAQAGANLISCLLEPQSQYGLIRYWSFKLVPEKGEVFAFYRFLKPEVLPLLPYRNWKR